jgi:hypothetical protein
VVGFTAGGLSAAEAIPQNHSCLSALLAGELAVHVGIELIHHRRRDIRTLVPVALVRLVCFTHALPMHLVSIPQLLVRGILLILREQPVPVFVEFFEDLGMEILAALGVIGQEVGALTLGELTVIVRIVDEVQEVPPVAHHPVVVATPLAARVMDSGLFGPIQAATRVLVISGKQAVEEPGSITLAEQRWLIDLAGRPICIRGLRTEGCRLLLSRGRAEQQLLLPGEGVLAAADEEAKSDEVGSLSFHGVSSL